MDLANISEFDMSLTEESFNLFDAIYNTMNLIKFKAYRKKVALTFTLLAPELRMMSLFESIIGDKSKYEDIIFNLLN